MTLVMERDLARLETLWPDGLEAAYATYLRIASNDRVALAAALVETGADLQGLGQEAADPDRLLLGDLCLARASRLLADVGDQRLQVGFARAIEEVAACAAGADDLPSLRALLSRTVGS